MSELLTTPEIVRNPAKEPAKRWRSRWRALYRKLACPDCGASAQQAGDIYDSCCGGDAPSYEVAKEWAREQIEDDIAECGFPHDEWLGAFPVEGSE